ncbi:unannotated protein [freshwater metagenome]|uniref:Unannotated protein n=1 Tax=freshwater metagenome TaxID=449393 RepID=A0A6J6JI50_9ZZZZ|nr:DUF4229 domain-containing protein [Actinomycetota bacterium]
MKNAWLNYILIRLGLFVGVLVILIAIGLDKFLSAVFAAMISLAISLIFFTKQRDRVSEAVYNRIKRNDASGSDDAESDLENAALDSKESKTD